MQSVKRLLKRNGGEMAEEKLTRMDRDQLILELQRQYCDNMSCFDLYEEKDYPILKQKVAFALFGPPQEIRNENLLLDDLHGDDFVKNFYGEKGQREKINLVYNAIIQNGAYDLLPRAIYMSVVLVMIETDEEKLGNTCVFRLRKCHAEQTLFEHSQEIMDITQGTFMSECHVKSIDNFCQIYVDDDGRVYESWKHYIENNKLPECTMYVPENGVYEREELIDDQWVVKLKAHKSPASFVSKKVVKYTDTVGTVGGIGSAVVMCAAAVPALTIAPVVLTGAAVVAGVTGAYTGIRGIIGLADRSKHKQTISLKDGESRGHWMSIAGGVAAGAASGVRAGTQKLIEKGITIGTVGTTVINMSTGANLIVNGCTVADSTYRVISKLKDGERPTSLEVLQLTTSIVFFCHAVATARSAKTIINESQGQVLQEYESSLSSNTKRKAFNKALKESERIYGINKGRSQMIRGLRNIENPDDLFASLNRNNKIMNQNDVRYTLSDNGQILLNDKVAVSPTELNAMPAADKTVYLSNIGEKPGNAPNVSKVRGVLNAAIPARLDPAIIGLGVRLGSIIINNRENVMAAINALLEEFIPAVQALLKNILVYIWDQVSDIEETIIRLFPNTAPLIIVTRFIFRYLAQYVRENCWEDANMPYYRILRSDNFNELLDNIDAEFLQGIVRTFILWIEQKQVALAEHFTRLEDLMIGSVKNKCKLCSGVYYTVVNN